MSDRPIANLIVGLGITGRAVAAALVARGLEVVALDDQPGPTQSDFAVQLGIPLVERPSSAQAVELVERAERVIPSPGIPDAHPAMRAARDLDRVWSEFDLAAIWDDRPIVAITGTNGKTTVTTMVTAMLNASGRPALAVGNTETPLVAALERSDIEIFVVEASSFRLAHSRHFGPQVATWLNFAPDHLDVHDSLASYEAAKAKLFLDQSLEAVAIANADDPVVMSHRGPARRITFSAESGDYRIIEGVITTDLGEPVVPVGELARQQPHDLANALAAAATARAAGADLASIARVLQEFQGLPHRGQWVAEHRGVQYFNDSKATVPEAVAAAVQGFASVVLIAGGKSKGLDMGLLTSQSDRLRAVVAIGESAAQVAEAFTESGVTTATARSMAEAVARAAAFAQPGDVVLLSPGGASQDWYRNYEERGDDFINLVQRLTRNDRAEPKKVK